MTLCYTPAMRLRLFPALEIPDDRGTRHRVQMDSLPGAGTRDARALRLYNRCTEIQTRSTIVPMGFAIVAGMLLRPVFPGWTGLLAFAPLLVGVIWLYHRMARRSHERTAALMAGQLVSEGFCGTCAYNLHELSPAPDRCIVCPECGAAWLQGRVRRTAPIDDRPPTPSQKLSTLKEFFKDTGWNRLDTRYVADDLGLPVRLITIAELRSMADFRDSARADAACAVLDGVMRATRRRRQAAAAALTAILLIAAVGIVAASEDHRIYFLLPAAVATIGFYAAQRTDLFVAPPCIIVASRSAALCASCGRVLACNASAPADEFTECEGCGASWRLPGR